MVWPGPSSRASRIAPAILMPVEPPRHRPSSCTRSKTIGSASSSGIWKEKSGVKPVEIGGDAALPDALGDRAAFGLEHARPCRSCGAPRPAGRRARSSPPCFSPSGRWRRRPACRRCRPTRRSRRPCRRSASRFPARWCGYGRRDWRHCRTGWPRSRRSARFRASCSASRPDTFT